MVPLRIIHKDVTQVGITCGKSLDVLDYQDALILHPRSKKGYLVNFGGISDGFQLQTLLEDLLIDNDDSRFLTGDKNDPQKVAQMKDAPSTKKDTLSGYFNMFRSNALDENCNLIDTMIGSLNTKIYGEDLPASIPQVDGMPCILLCDQNENIRRMDQTGGINMTVNITRMWNAERRLPLMDASMSLKRILTRPEVEDYMKRIAFSNR